jgi:hypothetical protein
VRDLPHSFCLSQNQGAAIDESLTVVQLKRHDSRIADDLHSQVARLEVHIRPRSSSRTDLFKDQAKVCFILGATVGSVRGASRIKDCGIVGERIAELVPLQMVERRNEFGEKRSNGRLFGMACRRLRAQTVDKQQEPGNQCSAQWNTFLFHDHLRSWDAVDAHIRAQNLRNDDGTVGLLIILHHSNPRTANRQARAV